MDILDRITLKPKAAPQRATELLREVIAWAHGEKDSDLIPVKAGTATMERLYAEKRKREREQKAITAE
jgi:hypothetical protein